MKYEKRDLPASSIELRSDAPEAGVGRLHGYAARFDKPSATLYDPASRRQFIERIAPGAFTRTLGANRDVRALWNHDTGVLLGRTTSGSLRLSEDETGLAFELDLPDTASGHEIRYLVGRGDCTGVSFGFEVVEDSWEERSGGPAVRTLLDIDLFEISPCTFPAYESTQVSVRSRHTRNDDHGATPRLNHAIRTLMLSASGD